MRLRILIAAAAAAATVSVLGPPAALAKRHTGRGGRCRVGINLAPHLIEAGEATLIFGRLRCGRSRATAKRSVKLMQRAAGTPAFRLAGTTKTDARGFYEFVRSGVEFNTDFFVRSQGATSATARVRVLAHVTLTGPPDGSQLLTGAPNKVTFSGTVNPHDVGATVVLQRQNANTGDDWRRIGIGQVIAGGSYSITHTFVVAGDANIRVLVRSQRHNVPSPSDVLTYEISQAQNPQLTINASADPIEVGQHVTITGTAKGAPSEFVTLLAHTAGQPGFVPVAEAKTDAAGNFTFPAQAPAASTFYEVRRGSTVSSVLYEGVRDLLTAQVSAITVRAGQPVTFSGAVAPDHSGHVIYLERQDRTGADFHVVQIGFVEPGSTYSIVHTVYEPGVDVFRVKIPGGPENEGAASPPFTVVVNRAPAAALKPEAPSNSASPSEGQA